MTTAADELAIRYEGPGSGTEIWGATQANFLVAQRGHPGREVGVFVNEAAMAFLAGVLGQELDDRFRANAARVVGRIWVRRRFAFIGRLEPLLVVARATFDETPGLLDEVRAAVGRNS